jgi:hypothetical protein
MTQRFASSGKMKKEFLGIIPAAALKVLLRLSSLDLVAENVARILVYVCVCLQTGGNLVVRLKLVFYMDHDKIIQKTPAGNLVPMQIPPHDHWTHTWSTNRQSQRLAEWFRTANCSEADVQGT